MARNRLIRLNSAVDGPVLAGSVLLALITIHPLPFLFVYGSDESATD